MMQYRHFLSVEIHPSNRIINIRRDRIESITQDKKEWTLHNVKVQLPRKRSKFIVFETEDTSLLHYFSEEIPAPPTGFITFETIHGDSVTIPRRKIILIIGHETKHHYSIMFDDGNGTDEVSTYNGEAIRSLLMEGMPDE